MLLLLKRSSGASKLCHRRYTSKNDISLRPLSSASSASSSLQAREKRECDEANSSFIPSNASVLGSSRLDLYQKHQDFGPKDLFYRFSTDLDRRGARVDDSATLPRLSTAYSMESELASLVTGGSTSSLLPSRALSDCSLPTSGGISTAAATARRPAAWRSISNTTLGNSSQNLRQRRRAPHQRQRHQHISQDRLFFSTDTEEKTPNKAPSPRIGTTKVPTPASLPVQTNPFASMTASPKIIMQKTMDLTISVFKTVFGFFIRLPGNVWYYISHPTERKERIAGLKELAKDELHHYWVGTKLLWADIQTARNLLGKTLGGNALTRRERKQLLRTVSDLFRLVPFSMFILIPFMEFALPFALRIFPNMLPSTFQDSLKAEESMKRELQSRIAMAQFFQETMEELAKEQKRKAVKRKKEMLEAGITVAEDDSNAIDGLEGSAASMLEFLEKARSGETIPPDVIIRYANYFHDDLTLDNMPRMQIINMCKYMSIPPYGSEAFLRFQLRHRIRVLKEDDQRILWEGISSLTKMELREACQERGMRSTGLSKDAYKYSLQQWLDLSVNKNVPISLLIMSRTFFLHEETFERKSDEGKGVTGLADAISGLDKDVLNQVILEVATSQEKLSNPDIRKIKLEVLSQQNELIRQEQAAREAAAKKKEEKAEPQQVWDNDLTDVPVDHTETDLSASASSAAPGDEQAGPSSQTKKEAKRETEDKDDRDLSTEEMDALSQLVSGDSVRTERAELERIKSAMKAEKNSDKTEDGGNLDHEISDADSATKKDTAEGTTPNGSPSDAMSSEEADQMVADTLEKINRQVDLAAEGSTKFTVHADSATEEHVEAADEEEEEPDDPVVARLKKKLESMVDKIEVQLSDVQVKIGDKMHWLDKDQDGILTREEMADVLQQVLKREITFEEAMEIAGEMDENHDGIFTVEELIKWIDEHKLVKFVEEGRDADMDKIMESQSWEHKKDESAASNKPESN